MQTLQLALGAYATNCYLVSGTQGRCVVIDPADDGAHILLEMNIWGLVPEAVLLTHGHYDHILAIPTLQREWPDLPVLCHPADWSETLAGHDMGQAFPTVSALPNLRPLRDGQVLACAGLCITVLETPGHTPGSVTFRMEDGLFTGDTLFYADIGRTDFKGGSYAQILRSLHRLARLEGDFNVLPGHGPASTLEYERRFNPYLKGGAGPEWQTGT